MMVDRCMDVGWLVCCAVAVLMIFVVVSPGTVRFVLPDYCQGVECRVYVVAMDRIARFKDGEMRLRMPRPKARDITTVEFPRIL